jgi:sortase B
MCWNRGETALSIGRKIVFILALMVFIGAAGAIVMHYMQGAREENVFEELKAKLPEKQGIQTDKGYVIAEYAQYYKENPDIIGWVEIEGTNIDYPVMQTPKENQYYLRRDFHKKYAVSGTPFLDAQSSIFKPTKNWLVYGHHMKNGAMFRDVTEYADKEFYLEHKTFRFDTIYKGGQAEYEVIAAFRTQIYPKEKTDVFKYYNYPGITTEKELKEYVEGIKDISLYDTGVEVKKGDQLVTLSTCSYHIEGKNGRFAVVGRRIK